MLFDNFDKFISIKYTLNDKIYYYIPYDVFNSLETCTFSTTDLYEFIKFDQYKFNYHIEENMEEDDIIYDEIIDYIETNNYLTTGHLDNQYCTDNYKIFKDKYLKFDIEDIFKSNEEINDFIKLCKIIKNKYYFSESIKSIFTDCRFIHYIKLKPEKGKLLKILY